MRFALAKALITYGMELMLALLSIIQGIVSSDPIDCVQYVCNNYGTNGTEGCSAHTIEARDLFDAVLADIRRYAKLALDSDEKRVRQLQQQLSSIGQAEQKALEREKRKLSKRLSELDKLFSALYEDRVLERITERNFDMVSRKYETEQAQLSARIEEINASLAEKATSDNGVKDFLSLIANYADAAELSAAMVNCPDRKDHGRGACSERVRHSGADN